MVIVYLPIIPRCLVTALKYVFIDTFGDYNGGYYMFMRDYLFIFNY